MAKPRYFRRVQATLQGGVDVELGPYTLLYGRAASGKDSIVRALALAARGAADDIEGKNDVKQGTALADLAPGRLGGVRSRALDTNGDVAVFTMEVPSPGTTKKPKHDPLPGVICPVVDLREKLLASDDVRRRWLVELIAEGLTAAQVLALLPPPLVPEYQAIETAVRAGRKGAMGTAEAVASPISMLIAVRDEVNTRKLTAVREAKAAEQSAKAVQDASGTSGGVPTAEEVEAARMALDEARAMLAQVPSGLPSTAPLPTYVSDAELASVAGLVTQRDNAATAWQAATASVQQLEAWLLDHPAMSEAMRAWAKDATAVHTSLRAVATQQIQALQEGRLRCCILCDSPLTAETFAVCERAVRTADAGLAEVDQIMAAETERSRWVQALDNAKGDVATTYRDWDSARLRIEDIEARRVRQEQEREAARSTLQGSASQLEGRRAELEGNVTQAIERHSDLRSRFDRYASVQAARSTAAVKKAEGDKYERLLEALDRVVKDAMSQAKDAFVADVRKNMPAPEDMPQGHHGRGGAFDIRLNDGAREVCDIGLLQRAEVAGEPPHEYIATALSGTEEIITRTAMAVALGLRRAARTVTKGAQPLILVTLNERGIHPDDLGAAMRAITAAKPPVQIVWTNAFPPTGRKPASWTLIDCDALVPPAEPFDRAVLGETSTKEEETTEPDAEGGEDGPSAPDQDTLAKARAVVLGSPGLPLWVSDPQRLGRALPVVAYSGGDVADVLRTAYPTIGMTYDRHTVRERAGEDDRIVRIWHRFDNGMVARIEGGRIMPYVGTCIDPAATTLTTPVWAAAGSDGSGPYLFAVGNAPGETPEAAVEQALHVAGIPSGDPTVAFVQRRHPTAGGREWWLLRNGAVVWAGLASCTVYAGSLQIEPSILAAARENIGRQEAFASAGGAA